MHKGKVVTGVNTQYFYYFEEVARSGSITQAAKKLHVSQQALSEYIKRMEAHYEITLFNRRPTLHLTHAGELLLAHIRQSIESEEILSAQFSRIRTHQIGRIRLGITPTRAPIFFPQIFARFNAKHPMVELSLHEDNTPILTKNLVEGKLDFVISLETNPSAHEGVSSDTLLADRKLYFLASSSLLVAHGIPTRRIPGLIKKGVCLQQIASIPIVLKPATSKIHEQLAQAYRRAGYKPNVIVESSHVFPMLPLCVAGYVGIFVNQTIYRYLTEHYKDIMQAVRVLPVLDMPVNCDIACMYNTNAPKPLFFNDFMQVVREVVVQN